MEKQKVFSAYLPFELKCEVINSGKEKEIGTLIGVYNDGSCVFGDIIESSHGFESVKPILFSLEDLTKPITIGVEKINVIKEIMHYYPHDYLIIKSFSSLDFVDFHSISYKLFQKLRELKFNVFNLPEDEYVKVTNNFNPYK